MQNDKTLAQALNCEKSETQVALILKFLAENPGSTIKEIIKETDVRYQSIINLYERGYIASDNSLPRFYYLNSRRLKSINVQERLHK